MFIKWHYDSNNGKGTPRWKEMEVEDGWNACHWNIKEYICKNAHLPFWAERFKLGKLKWKKIKYPSKSFVKRNIKHWKSQMNELNNKIIQYETLLGKIK